MTVAIDWKAGHGAAWTSPLVDSGSPSVVMYCGSSSTAFYLKADQAEKLGEELVSNARRAREMIQKSDPA